MFGRYRRPGGQRSTVVLILAIAMLAGGAVFSVRPAGASPSNAVDPAQLALPVSVLPTGAVIDKSTVSDNTDANASSFHLVHQHKYEALGRLTGYRQDFHYTIQGSPAGTEYLASVFSSPDQARTAMNDAIGSGSLISIIGTPLTHGCTVGDACQAFSGPNPGLPAKVVLAIFVHGSVMVETASQVPAIAFDQLEPALETALYGLLAAADHQIEIAQGLITAAPTGAAATASPTDTPVPPTDTPTPQPAVHKCKKNMHVVQGKCKCKKGYKSVHGKCKKVKL